MHITTSTQPALDLGFGGYSRNGGVHICGLYEPRALDAPDAPIAPDTQNAR